MPEDLRIDVIGDFKPGFHSHWATNSGLYDTATKLKVSLELRWIPTESLQGDHAEENLDRWDGLLASPESPYKSFLGLLRGIRYARERALCRHLRGLPICSVRHARNILNIADADTLESK